MASKLFSKIIDLLEQPCDVTVSFKDFGLMLNGVFMLIIRPSISRFGAGQWAEARGVGGLAPSNTVLGGVM